MDIENLLSNRTKGMGSSAISEILKVMARPGVISLAGGFPSSESFPMEIINELTTKVCEKYSSRAFQYDCTEGFLPLRETLAGYMKNRGIAASLEDMLIASGSQGVLDSVGKIFISPGDKIAVEAPTYLGAIQAFNPYQPEYVRMDTDDDGLIPESLELVLQANKVKFIYLVPTFQNPTGRTITLQRRQDIAAIIQKHNVMLIEDDPYSELRYYGTQIQPIKTLAPDNVVYVSTLSKVLAPGLRIGFCAAPKSIRKWLTIVKQGVDIHTSTFNQALADEYISGGYLQKHLPKIIKIYKPKQQAMLDALEKYFPKNFKWSKPQGGMFIWVQGPEGLDMGKIYWECIEEKAAFVPGKFFFTRKGEGIETMRLNYTMATEQDIAQAVKTIAGVIKRYM